MQFIYESEPLKVEYFPGKQFAHLVSCVAPNDIEYFPAMHSMHVLAPVMLDHVPLEQYKQSVTYRLPGVERNLPATQSWQVTGVVAPSKPEYFPALQRVHDSEPAVSL